MEGSDEDDEELEAISLQAMRRATTNPSEVIPSSEKNASLENSVKVEPPTEIPLHKYIHHDILLFSSLFLSLIDLSLLRPLSFGYMDKFGRFVTEAEPEPGQKKKQGTKNVNLANNTSYKICE